MAALNRRIGNVYRDLQVLERLSMLTSARNHFSGKVHRIKRGAVNDEVELELRGGERIVAIVTRESTEQLGLKVGADAIAFVKASSVIISTDGASTVPLSARNQLQGIASRLVKGAVNTEVVIELQGGTSMAAIITNASAKNLGRKKVLLRWPSSRHLVSFSA
jgi:molybdate transport system regulatory protein